MIQTFEKWLEEDKWEPEGVLDDDMPDAFEVWLGELDTQEVMDFAEEWGEKRFLDGKEEIMKQVQDKIIAPIKEMSNIITTAELKANQN